MVLLVLQQLLHLKVATVYLQTLLTFLQETQFLIVLCSARLLDYTDHLSLTLLLTLGNLLVLVRTTTLYQRTVVLRLSLENRFLRTMVVYMSLVLTNLVTSRLVHSLRLKTELVLLPSQVQFRSRKLNS